MPKFTIPVLCRVCGRRLMGQPRVLGAGGFYVNKHMTKRHGAELCGGHLFFDHKEVTDG